MIDILLDNVVFSVDRDGSYSVKKNKRKGIVFYPSISPEEYDLISELYDRVKRPIPYSLCALYCEMKRSIEHD